MAYTYKQLRELRDKGTALQGETTLHAKIDELERVLRRIADLSTYPNTMRDIEKIARKALEVK